MGKYLLILIVLCGFIRCSKFPNKTKIYYFYDAKNMFLRHEEITDSSYWLDYSIHVPPQYKDSFSLTSVGIAYVLDHSCKSSSCRDTSFVKPKLALDTIDYFDTEWIKNEKNLYAFWEVDKHGREYFNLKDSLLIYAIEPIEGTDSVIFRRVRRYYMKDTD
jgi:hypothetical protein